MVRLKKMITKPTKYTPKFVYNEVTELLSLVRENKDILFIGQLIEEKPYTIQRFCEWNKMGGKITVTIEKIKNILETRAIDGGINNRLNSSITKFHLINNYNWKDKNETDVTSGGEKVQGVVILPTKNESTLETPTKTGDSA